MGYKGVAPIRFGTLSMVTATLGANDPELATKITEDGRDYIFVYNGGNSQISPGYAGCLQSSATNYSVTVSAATSADFVLGVCRHATLTTGTYGWLVSKGITPVQMGATNSSAVAQRDLIEVGANGVFERVSNTTGNKAAGVGQALDAIATGASGSAFISCYG